MWSKILTASSYDLQLWKKFLVYFLLSTLLFLASVRFSEADVNVRIYDTSREVYHNISINNGPLNSTYYNSCCISLVYTFGLNGKTDGNTTITFMDGMFYYKNNVCCANVFLLDWSELASTPDGIGEYATKILYASDVIPKAMATGNNFGDLLLYWAEYYGFKLSCLHLMGHSLGAHLMGNAGRRVNKKGKEKIYKITGFDCAAALFGNLSIYPRLDKTCATCVFGIHSDPTSSKTSNRLGINETVGKCDIWLNYYTFDGQVQPGCPTGKQQFMSNADLCSHNRAPQVYALTWYYQTCCLICLNGTLRQNQTVCQNETENQTVCQNETENQTVCQNETESQTACQKETESQTPTFQASWAPNYYAWVAGNGSSSVIVLGACGNCIVSGNYYLTTTGIYPYAKGVEGAYPP